MTGLCTPEPSFKVVGHVGPCELREYDPRLCVLVTSEGVDAHDARSQGFQLLHAYINGANQASQRFPMTAPVQESFTRTAAEKSESRPAPATELEERSLVAVIQHNSWCCCCCASFAFRPASARLLSRFVTLQTAFFLPPSAQSAPAPKDKRVRAVSLPRQTMMVYRYSGLWTEGNAAAARDQLCKALRAHKEWTAMAEPVLYFCALRCPPPTLTRVQTTPPGRRAFSAATRWPCSCTARPNDLHGWWGVGQTAPVTHPPTHAPHHPAPLPSCTSATANNMPPESQSCWRRAPVRFS
jgi:hypothetical protein